MWTAQDRDKAIWHRSYRAEFCSECGTHPDEWDPSRSGDRQAYVAVQVRCAGCAVLEQAQEAYESAPKESKGRGVRITLKQRMEPVGDDQDPSRQHR